jgi:hypothetical protein
VQRLDFDRFNFVKFARVLKVADSGRALNSMLHLTKLSPQGKVFFQNPNSQIMKNLKVEARGAGISLIQNTDAFYAYGFCRQDRMADR